MEYKTVEQLARVAEVREQPQQAALSRNERLERWAQLLEAQPDRQLATLHRTENESRDTRRAMRSSSSPISVALEDPILREAGLKDDSYGEAIRFFEISDRDLHDVLCYCHFGASMRASTAARSVRSILGRQGKMGLLHRLLRWPR